MTVGETAPETTATTAATSVNPTAARATCACSNGCRWVLALRRLCGDGLTGLLHPAG
jgi:hypothetical protein